jgi:hypothetical protein
MSDTSTAPEKDSAAPSEAETVAPETTTEPTADVVAAEPVAAEPVVAEPVVVEPEAAQPVVVEPAVDEPAEAPVQPQQVVYVAAPKPFVAKGNRGFGVLVALLSTVIFAALYALAVTVVELVEGHPADLAFLSTADFWAPVGLFAIGFVVLALIVNRAGWAAYVFGSAFVGLFVYFGFAAAFLVIHASSIPSNEIGLVYRVALSSVVAIVAGVLAREVSLWMGIAIAARGRRIKARNIEALKLYNEEIETKRAEYESGQAPAA